MDRPHRSKKSSKSSKGSSHHRHRHHREHSNDGFSGDDGGHYSAPHHPYSYHPYNDLSPFPTPTRAQLAGYRSPAYSNPDYPAWGLYPSLKDFYYTMPLTGASSDSVPDSHKRRYAPSSEESGQTTGSWKKLHRCKVIAAVVVLVIFVAVAITLGVYFSARQMSDNRVEGEENTSTAPPTAPIPEQPNPDVEVTLRLTDREYTTDLDDPTSPVYQDTKREMQEYVDAVVSNSNMSNLVNYTEVTGFGQGSLKVYFIIVFITVAPTPSLEDRLEEAKADITLVAVAIVQGVKAVKDVFTAIVVDIDDIIVNVPTTAATVTTTPPLTTTMASTTSQPTSTSEAITTVSQGNATASQSTTSQPTSTASQTSTVSQPTATTTQPTTASQPTTTSQTSTTTFQPATTSQPTTASQPTTSESQQITSKLPTTASQPTTTSQPAMTTSQPATTSQSTAATPQTTATSQPTTTISPLTTSTLQEPATTTQTGTTTTEPGTEPMSTTTQPPQAPSSTTAPTSDSGTRSSRPTTTTTSSSESTTMSQEATSSQSSEAVSPTPKSSLSPGVSPSTGTQPTLNSTSASSSPPSSTATSSTPTVTSKLSTLFMSSQTSTTTPRSLSTTSGTAGASAASSSLAQPSTTETTFSSAMPGKTTLQALNATSPPSSASMPTGTVRTTTATTVSPFSSSSSTSSLLSTTSSALMPADSMEDPMFIATLTLADSQWQGELANASSSEFQQLAESVQSEVDMMYSLSDAAQVYSHSRMVSARNGSVIVSLMLYLKLRSSLISDDQRSLHDQLMGDDGSLMKGYFEQGLQRFGQEGNVPALVFSNLLFRSVQDLSCPGWKSLVLGSECRRSFWDMLSSSTFDNACYHYAMTVKCIVFVLRANGQTCNVTVVQQLTRDDPSFSQEQDLAAVCPESNLQFSVDLDKQPLCAVPDAVSYIAQYHDTGYDDQTSDGDTSYYSEPMAEPTAAPKTNSASTTTTTIRWYNTTSTGHSHSSSAEDMLEEQLRHIPTNPCTAAVRRTLHVRSVLASLGLQCDYVTVFNTLSSQNFSRASHIAQDFRRCNEFYANIQYGDGLCFNEQSLSCIAPLTTVSTSDDMPISTVCAIKENMANCLSENGGCSLEDGRRSVTEYMSVSFILATLTNTSTNSSVIENLYRALNCSSDDSGREPSLMPCPEWDPLLSKIYGACGESIGKAQSAVDIQTACQHYASTLKCLTFNARASYYNCTASELQSMSLNDTWVFSASAQVRGYNLPFMCRDWSTEFIADLDETPLCESPDAYIYMTEYVCTDRQLTTTATHHYSYYTSSWRPFYTTRQYHTGSSSYYPWHTTAPKNPSHPSSYYPWQTTTRYPHGTSSPYPWHTSKTSNYYPWQTSTTRYPSGSSNSQYPWKTTTRYPSGSSNSYYPWKTTTRYPSGSSNSYYPWQTTTRYPYKSYSSHYPWYTTTIRPPYASTSYIYPGYWTTSKYYTSRSTFSTGHPGMPNYPQTGCNTFVQKAECIHSSLNWAGLSCRKEAVYRTIEKYNDTLLTRESSQCAEHLGTLIGSRCFGSVAQSRCSGDLYILSNISTYDPPDVCDWWYNRAMDCISYNLGSDCPVSAVDGVWRQYLYLLYTVRETTSALQTYRFPIIEEVLRCPTDYIRPPCPSYHDLLSRSSEKCWTIFASLLTRNSSYTGSDTLSDTAHTPNTLQQRCRLYEDLLRCLALSMQGQYSCNGEDLHSRLTESPNFRSQFGFYPSECSVKTSNKTGPRNVCENADLYELLLQYNCRNVFNSSIADNGVLNSTVCLRFFGTMSCLSREATALLHEQTCTEEDVSSALASSMNASMETLRLCFNKTLFLGPQNRVLLRHQNRWVTMCGRNWDSLDAKVVCGELGFEYGRAFNRSGETYVDGLGRVLPGVSNLRCQGYESSWKACSYDGYPMCSSYDQVAAVICSHTELRYQLVPAKPGVAYGYINMTRDTGAGLVCSNSIPDSGAASLCRAAGFPNGGMIYPFHLDPPAPADVWRNYVSCGYSYQDVEGCVYDRWQLGPPVWTNNSDGRWMGFPCDGAHGNLVKVFCFEKLVKFHTGLFNTSGVPQVFRSGDKSSVPEPHTFCRNGFDNFTASMFCNEIGFPQGGISLGFNPYDFSGSQRYVHASCSGQEALFSECEVYESSYCPYAAVVRCQHEPEDGVAELDVRLQKIDYSAQSLVLTYVGGEWGSVCADHWTETEANTVCRSEGYQGGFASKMHRGQFIPHVIHNLTCNDSSNTLQQCQYREVQSDVCRYQQAAAVRCYNESDLAQYSLRGGADDSYGLVYVSYNNTEGLLCADLSDTHFQALCRGLGFLAGERYHDLLPLPSHGHVWGASFSHNCDDESQSLEACRQDQWYSLYTARADNFTDDRLPSCYYTGGFAKAFCYSSAVRLNTGFLNRTGVLQLYDDRYYHICREGLSDAALDKLCQVVTGLDTTKAEPLSSSLFIYLYSSGTVHLNSSCVLSGQAVDTCVETKSYCSSDRLSAVHCYEGKLSDDITGWKLDSGGRVMVQRYGTYGVVCRDQFNDATADLFCKSQGKMGGYLSRDYAYTYGRLPMWVHTVSCPENAESFWHCNITLATNETQCFTRSAASVRCYSREEKIRLYLVDTYTDDLTITGRVVAEKDNRTGYMCRSWAYDDMMAEAFCKMMNYTNGGYLARNSSRLPEPDWSRPAWSANLHCASGSPSLDVMKCLVDWSYEMLFYPTDNIPQRTECSRNLANVTCYRVVERPGRCPPSDGFGITIHECDNDFDCYEPKKCCEVGGGAGQVCRDPIHDHTSPSPTPTSTPSSLWPCPGWSTVWDSVAYPCRRSLDSARYSHDRCWHYGKFLTCASFAMRARNYNCPVEHLQEMARVNYWYFDTSGMHGGSSTYYHGSSSYPWSSYHGSSYYYGSSSGYYGSSSGYYGSSSYYYGPSGSSSYDYGSSYGYGSSGSYPMHSGSSSDYYGSSSYDYGSSYDYYGSSSYHYGPSGSSSYDYGSSSYGYGSSGSYPTYSGSSSDYLTPSSDYYGSSSDYYGSSSYYYGPSGTSSYDYGSSSYDYESSGSYPMYSGSSSDYYGSHSDYYGSSSGYYGPSSYYYGPSGSSSYGYGSSSSYHSGSYPMYSDSHYHGSSSGYYGSASSLHASGSDHHGHAHSGGSPDYYMTSTDYNYGSAWHDHGSSSSGYGPSSNSSSLPVWCRGYPVTPLVKAEYVEPCANPDAFQYILQYHCQDYQLHSTTSSPYYSSYGYHSHHSSSSYGYHSHHSSSWYGDNSHHSSSWYGDSSHHSSSWYGDSSHHSSSWYGDNSHHSSSWYGDNSHHSSSWYGDSSHHSSSWYGDDSDHSSPWYGDSSHHSSSWYGDNSHHSSYSYDDHSHHSSSTYGGWPHSSSSSSWGYYTPTPGYVTTPTFSAPDNACMRLSRKFQCVQRGMESVGLTCSASAMYPAFQQFSSNFLSTDVSLCHAVISELLNNSCFNAILSGGATCLRQFNQTTSYGTICSKLSSVVDCSVSRYPGSCTHGNTAAVLRQWLSAEVMMKNLSIMAGVNISHGDKESLLRCPYFSAKQGCPSYEQLVPLLSNAFYYLSDTVHALYGNTTVPMCRLYEDLLAAAILVTADYPQCSAEDLHQLAVDNQGIFREQTNISVGECAGQVTFPMINKTSELCSSSYLLKFLNSRRLCAYTNLSDPVAAEDACPRAFEALSCYQRLYNIFLAAGVECGLDALIAGLKANPKYLHQSYWHCMDSGVLLTSQNMVVMRVGPNHWSRICGDGWDNTDAQVACRALGYNLGYAFNSSGYYSSDEIGNAANDIINMRCSGNEAMLQHCLYNRTDFCPSYSSGGAVCYMTAPEYEIVSSSPGTPYGFVRRTVGSRSAFVSSTWFPERAANLLCKAAGYDGGIPFTRFLDGVDMGLQLWDTYLDCEGSATSIEQCATRNRWNYVSRGILTEHANGSVTTAINSYYQPIKVFCFVGETRLHNSMLNSTGLAMIYNDGDDNKYNERLYLGICRNGFDDTAATLFCRSLGLGFENGSSVPYQPFRNNYDYNNYFNVSCSGAETTFQECRVTRSTSRYCSAGYAVARCLPRLEAVPEQPVRLGPDNRTVEIYHNDEWGYVCSDRWTDSEAEQICRALSYDHGYSETEWHGSTTQYPFLMHNVNCDGASAWSDCSYSDVDSNVCQYSRPAKVFCYNQGDLPTYSLYNGNSEDTNPTYGWVHVTIGKVTGRLCSYFYPESHYRVLCRQLGFIDGDEYRSDPPEQEDLPFWTTSFDSCGENSRNLETCRSQSWEKGEVTSVSSYSNGSYSETREPYCYRSPVKAFCYDKPVRVHSGYFNTSGILEVARSQTFYQVCAETSTYTQSAANVVCHALTGSPTSSAIIVRKNIFSYKSKTVLHVNFSCSGTEQDLDCMTVIGNGSQGNCDNYYNRKIVAVVCYEGERPADGITEWRVAADGNVLVKQFGLWGLVCSPTWITKEAEAVCRTAGYYSGVPHWTSAYGTNLPIWVEALNCSSDAAGVAGCSVTLKDYSLPQGSDYNYCDGRRAACYQQEDLPHLFFADNEALSEPHRQGRVAVRYHNETRYYCVSLDGSSGHSTMCRIMGFPRGGKELGAAASSLPQPRTYGETAWSSDMTCGHWDRSAHLMSCMRNWNEQDIYNRYYDSSGNSYASSFTFCGEHIVALSCMDNSTNYRVVSASGNGSHGMLLVWNEVKQQWYSVCNSNFSSNEANAACRELGFPSGGRPSPAGYKPDLSYSIGTRQFQCSGQAGEMLSDCTVTDTNYLYCSTNEAWVVCYNGTSVP